MWKIETLDTSRHDRGKFSCGEEDMDQWLQRHAGQSGRRDETLTRVLVRDDDPRVLGYYSQLSYSLMGDELQKAMGADQRYPIPCVLIARLARCNSVRGENVGTALLAHALRACVGVGEQVGLKFVVVHALHDKAARFYESFGFTRFVDHELSLMMSMKEIRKTFS